MIVVESGIPIPRKRPSATTEYPFEDMKVGDSFSLNGCGKKPWTIGYLAAVFARRQVPQWKFTVRRTADGYRCWRIY